MTLKMSEGDKVAVVDSPTYIVTPRSSEVQASKGIQKKHVLIVVGMVILAGLIIAGILIGMHIYAEQQKEIVKFTLQFKSTVDGKDVKQDVESDPNDNVVQYHVSKDGKDVDVVNDFNRDMQVVKMEMNNGISCFISALNRTVAVDPSNINVLQTQSNKKDNREMFSVSNTPIADRSFMPKKAQAMCSGLSVYWAYRGCSNQKTDTTYLNNTSSIERDRRASGQAGYWNGLACVYCGCWKVCSCYVAWAEYSDGTCQFYYEYGTCCGVVAQPYCSNAYAFRLC